MNRVNLSQALNGARGSISLKSLEWFVKAQDLFVTCCAKQHYRNDGSETLEIVYSFPLSWKSVVTGFAAVIDGMRYVARTLKKSEAEEKYERHIAQGDKPMLLEVNSELGICTANLGNLKPGEEITLEISWAKMAVWDEGAVRITIPSVIADRYDRTGGQGGLLPHQRVESNFLAQYPCSLRFELSGILAEGSVCVPQHPVRVSREEACTVVEVTGAFADRDITLEVTDLKQTPPSLLGKDGETWVGCPVFMPAASEESSGRRLCIKTLVDCSGSMSGLSITQAKSAIAALPSMLKPEDKVTLSLFGSSVVHRITTARACTAKFLRQDWLPEIERIDARLGGTEMEQAIRSVCGLDPKTTAQADADILLVTDGQIWEEEGFFEFVKSCGHRIFILGVGLAPAEIPLRRLAEASGGACDFVMPAEDMREPLGRLVRKMYKNSLHIDPAAIKPAAQWSGMLESTLFAGEGRGVFCGYANKPQETAAVACADGGAELKAAPWKEIDERGFIQLAAWARYGVAESFAEQTELALRYELLTDRTDMLLVKEMADNGNSSDGPVLQKIPQMGRVSHDPRYQAQYDDALEFDPERGMEDLQLEFCRPSPSRARPFRLDQSEVNYLKQPRGPRSRRREADKSGAEPSGGIFAELAAFLQQRPDEPLHIDARKVFEALQQAGAATLDDAVGVLEKRDVLGKAGVERLCLRWCFLGSDKKRIVAALVVLWGSERGYSVSKALVEAARDLLRQGGVTDDKKEKVFGILDLVTAPDSATGGKAEP